MLAFTVLQGQADTPDGDAVRGETGVNWCRFGPETLVWRDSVAADGRAAGLPARLQRLGGPPQTARGELYLVVQVGNAFVAEFPDARVLVNKGRYLAVDLTPSELRAVQAHDDACFGLCPLPRDTVVLALRPPSRRQPDPAIAALVGMVSQAQLGQSVAALTLFRTRHSLSGEFSSAADWCCARLSALGYASTKSPIPVASSTSFNVIADKPGQGSNRKLVLVTAHLDSVNLAGGATAAAPGADDNASGVAGALEIARVLAPHAATHDLRVVLFGGEEQGLRGSRHYVAGLAAAERGRLHGVINMDMIARLNTAAATVLLEGAALSQSLMSELADAAHDYTALQVQTSLNPFASDHVPFIDAGLAAVLAIEGADSANHDIHTANDTPDKLHLGLAGQIVQSIVAVVASRLGLAGGGGGAPRQSSSPVVAWGANRLDVFVLGTDRAMYHKWWGGSSWGPSLTGYESMGGVCTSVPQVVAWGPNRLDVFLTGTDSALYHKWWNGSSWGPSLTGYERMGGVCLGDPRAVAWGANRLDVFVIGTDRALYHKWWNGASWGPSLTGYEYMGGMCLSAPKVVSWGPNRLDVFVVGGDGAVYHKWWNGSAWGPSLTGWERMGGVCVGEIEAVAWGPNRLDLFVIGTDSALYHKWWNGSSWGPSLTGYERMGGVITSRPRVTAWGPNRLDVFVTGTDSALYHKWWNGSSWGPSLTGYERMGGVITVF